MLKNKIVLSPLFFIIIFTSCHVVKSVLYLRPDHKDVNKFPKHEVKAAAAPIQWGYFEKQLDLDSFIVSYKDGHLETLTELLENGVTNAFLIIKDNKILVEKYYNNYSAEKTHGSFSVSKGMLSTMLGLAIEDGLIGSLEDPIVKYLPELLSNDSAFSQITLHHLLDMTSGIKIRGRDANLFGDLAKTYYGRNWARFMSTIEIGGPPGEAHFYNQTDPQIMSLIISKVTGKSLSDYFSEKIWSKISVQSAFWNIYGKDDLEKGFCCFNARPRDYAKFAQLYLQKGMWNGEQLIPKAWIDFVTTIENPIESKYVFSFHKYWFPANDASSIYTAQGYNGQFIYINPDKNLSILRFAKKEELETISWEQVLRDLALEIN
jgi:CubicO group peptidase (beta-lactamase class C family)